LRHDPQLLPCTPNPGCPNSAETATDERSDVVRTSTPAETDGLLIVPPFSRSTSGPPLGPAQLAGAARDVGLQLKVTDLAIEVIHELVPEVELATPSGFAGDHDKNGEALKAAHEEFLRPIARGTGLELEQLRTCKLEWDDVDRAVECLVDSSWADRTRRRLSSRSAPALVGLSVMFADQVLAGLAVSRIVRRLWPTTPIVWGGAHVTALGPEIAKDSRYGIDVDGFVAGYAEKTFVDLLRARRHGVRWPDAVFRAGSGAFERAGGDLEQEPRFEDLGRYGAPRLSLPVQATRGCHYGQCRFCTYPFVEGAYLKPDTLAHLSGVIDLAVQRGAVVSFKDALLTPSLLRQIARMIDGRVQWSACTKLGRKLIELLPVLGAAECRTLEVGYETAVETSQLLIRKRAPTVLLDAFLSGCAASGIRPVVNYMTGLPGENAEEALAALADVRERVRGVGRVEHHQFELERRAPMADHLAVLRCWPWSSVVEWRASPQRSPVEPSPSLQRAS
jgi:hypothetical protein